MTFFKIRTLDIVSTVSLHREYDLYDLFGRSWTETNLSFWNVLEGSICGAGLQGQIY